MELFSGWVLSLHVPLCQKSHFGKSSRSSLLKSENDTGSRFSLHFCLVIKWRGDASLSIGRELFIGQGVPQKRVSY
ncbi:hypothetical protein ACOSP7_000226 [Xanthoceras sorbifolium]